MMDYEEHACPRCGDFTLIYHQYQADYRCESCGCWECEVYQAADLYFHRDDT